MIIPQPIFAILRLIVERLEETPITWAITGSCSLALQGVPIAVHDIDLRTTAEDAYRIEAAFQEYRTRPVVFARTGAVQSHFGALEIDGVQVEIIGDMQHRLADGAWEPIVDMNRFKEWVVVDEMRLPVMSLPFLHEAYRLLGRADKVAVLEAWFQHGTKATPTK